MAEIESLEAARSLIFKGADVHAKNVQGETPLHRAAMNGNEGGALLLIENGADVNAKDDIGRTPLYEAAQWSDRTGIVELLLSKGADVNAKDVLGGTPLAIAKSSGNKQMAKWLSHHGGHE